MWWKKTSGVKILFLLIRYGTILCKTLSLADTIFRSYTEVRPQRTGNGVVHNLLNTVYQGIQGVLGIGKYANLFNYLKFAETIGGFITSTAVYGKLLLSVPGNF